MKTGKRFVFFFAAAISICCALCVLCSVLSLDRMRENNNRNVIQLISSVRARVPDITDAEIMQILNAKEDTLDTEKMLGSFGISTEDWAVEISESDSARVVTASVCACLLCGLSCFGVFLLYRRRRQKNAERLTDYLAQINSGDYDLALDSNSESADSRLQNEIYRTTVTLRESAQQSAESREKLKTALSDISHQLKTPLTSMIIMTENLLDNPELPQELRQEFLRDIYRSSNHFSFLVQSLLTLSKLDADSIVLKRKPEPLSEIFSEVNQSIAVLAELRGVTVTANDNGVSLECDKKWLCEALSNIAKNCAEHTDEGGEVRLTAEANPLYTKITISDNGSGIDKTDLPHIFERFYKGKNADENSVGIGLALAKTIIQKSGGTVSADSEPGKGASFTVKFYNRTI
nr:HAMP domain-containing sensor histidine kinase [uncultured Ruminococcus sp.]